MLSGERAARRFRTSVRQGEGPAAAVRPSVQMPLALHACGRHDANSEPTGGSTPRSEGRERPAVVPNAIRLRGILPIRNAEQAVAPPGATLDRLEKTLRHSGRELRSVIGSRCIGVSVIICACNNSGGSPIRRGPAGAEAALYAQRGADAALRLVEHLENALGEAAEEILARLDRSDLGAVESAASRRTSDRACARRTPGARLGADPRRLHGASGGAGAGAVFARRRDTFPGDAGATVFCIGANDPGALTARRRRIPSPFGNLPVAGVHRRRDGRDLTMRCGTELFLLIKRSEADRVAPAFASKASGDGVAERLGLGGAVSDRIAQGLGDRAEGIRRPRLRRGASMRSATVSRRRLMRKTDAAGFADARAHPAATHASAAGDFFECTTGEGEDAFLHSFAFDDAAGRHRALNRDRIRDILALGTALPRTLPG